ncbi:MAG: hypothetical protein ACXIUZ_05925 [Lysobacteraceae bacterium]
MSASVEAVRRTWASRRSLPISTKPRVATVGASMMTASTALPGPGRVTQACAAQVSGSASKAARSASIVADPPSPTATSTPWWVPARRDSSKASRTASAAYTAQQADNSPVDIGTPGRSSRNSVLATATAGTAARCPRRLCPPVRKACMALKYSTNDHMISDLPTTASHAGPPADTASSSSQPSGASNSPRAQTWEACVATSWCCRPKATSPMANAAQAIRAIAEMASGSSNRNLPGGFRQG